MNEGSISEEGQLWCDYTAVLMELVLVESTKREIYHDNMEEGWRVSISKQEDENMIVYCILVKQGIFLDKDLF